MRILTKLSSLYNVHTYFWQYLLRISRHYLTLLPYVSPYVPFPRPIAYIPTPYRSYLRFPSLWITHRNKCFFTRFKSCPRAVTLAGTTQLRPNFQWREPIPSPSLSFSVWKSRTSRLVTERIPHALVAPFGIIRSIWMTQKSKQHSRLKKKYMCIFFYLVGAAGPSGVVKINTTEMISRFQYRKE